MTPREYVHVHSTETPTVGQLFFKAWRASTGRQPTIQEQRKICDEIYIYSQNETSIPTYVTDFLTERR